jgi:hypothetical protein
LSSEFRPSTTTSHQGFSYSSCLKASHETSGHRTLLLTLEEKSQDHKILNLKGSGEQHQFCWRIINTCFIEKSFALYVAEFGYRCAEFVVIAI